MERVFKRLGFNNISSDSNEYIRQYNAEITTLIMGHAMCLAAESVDKDLQPGLTEQLPDHPTFEEQRRNIEVCINKGKGTKHEKPVDDDI